MTYRQTHPVQNENREKPQPLIRASHTLQARGAWFNETLDVTLGGETRIFLSYNFWTFHLPGEMCKGIFRETDQSIYIYKVVTWDKMHFLSITHFFKKNTLFTFWINKIFFLYFFCV